MKYAHSYTALLLVLIFAFSTSYSAKEMRIGILRNVKIKQVSFKVDSGSYSIYSSDTLNFLKSVTSKYKNTIYIGSSMGGYASILFASLLKGITVIAQMPQTDLEYIINNNSCIDIFEPIKNKHSDIWNSYKNLNPIINDSTHYIMGGFDPTASVLHDMHHKNNIKSHENVTLPNDFDFVKEVNKHI